MTVVRTARPAELYRVPHARHLQLCRGTLHPRVQRAENSPQSGGERAPSRGTWRHLSMRLADLASPPRDLALDYVQVAAGSPFLDRSNSDGFERFWKFETGTIPGDALHSDRTTAECFSYDGLLFIMSSLILVGVLINCISYLPSPAQA